MLGFVLTVRIAPVLPVSLLQVVLFVLKARVRVAGSRFNVTSVKERFVKNAMRTVNIAAGKVALNVLISCNAKIKAAKRHTVGIVSKRVPFVM